MITHASILLFGYFLPLVLSTGIMMYYMYRDVQEDLSHEGDMEDLYLPPYVVTVGDVLKGVLFCVLPVFNWVIPLRFVWEGVKELEHRLALPLQQPIVSRKRGTTDE